MNYACKTYTLIVIFSLSVRLWHLSKGTLGKWIILNSWNTLLLLNLSTTTKKCYFSIRLFERTGKAYMHILNEWIIYNGMYWDENIGNVKRNTIFLKKDCKDFDAVIKT